MNKLQVTTNLNRDSQSGRYIIACARIRGVAVATLVHHLLDVIAQDQLVLAILDDESRLMQLKPGDHRFMKEMA